MLGCAATNGQKLGAIFYFFGNSPIIWSARKHSGIQASRQPIRDFKSQAEQTHGRTKHMDLCYKFCGEVMKLGKIKIVSMRTEYNIADIFTKSLSTVRYRNLCAALVGNVSAILRDPTNAQNVAMHLQEFLAQL